MFFGLIFTRRRHDITLKKKENKKTVQAAGECAMRCNWFATRMPIACGQTYTRKQALSRVLAGAPSIKGFGERRQRANLSKSCCLCCTSNFCSHDSRTGDDISQPASQPNGPATLSIQFNYLVAFVCAMQEIVLSRFGECHHDRAMTAAATGRSSGGRNRIYI